MSLTHIWDDSMEDDLLASTVMFWNDIINNQELSYMITPDCRIASGFHQRAIGVNGIEKCLDLLSSLQKSLSHAQVDTEMQNLMLMKTGTQTRFYIKDIHMERPFTLSFALEWCNGMISVKFVDFTFLACFFLYHFNSGIITGIVILKEKSVDAGFLRDRLDYSSTANGTLGRRGSLCADYSKEYFFMGGTMDPPYHMPIPPNKLATVVVTVLNCKNLKSRLKRVVPRCVNAQVVVEFNGTQQKTTAVKNSKDPVFAQGGGAGDQHENPFVFEIPETLDERDPNACIKFLVDDVHGFGVVSDRLCAVKVPLAAIKCVANTNSPIKMNIPLQTRRRHFGIRETVGIKTKNDNVRVSRPDDANVQVENCPGEATSLTVLISKTDDLKLWLLNELRERDMAWKADVIAERELHRSASEAEGQDAPPAPAYQSPQRSLKECTMSPRAGSYRKPANDETNYSKLFPYFLWSLSRDKYDDGTS